MRSGNPALREKMFAATTRDDGAIMTLNGTVDKTAILLAVVVAGGAFTWSLGESATPLMIGGAIVGLILALVTVFNPQRAPVLAPLYAAAEGLFLGGISRMFESAYSGIVVQAVILTFAIMIAMLLLYRSGVIKVTRNFRLGVIAATGGIALYYGITLLLNMFGVPVGYWHNGSTLGVLIGVGIVVIAALNLVLDFDFIEAGARNQAPKHMEWYGAFGLLVTLVWLYVEILRLLAILNRR